MAALSSFRTTRRAGTQRDRSRAAGLRPGGALNGQWGAGGGAPKEAPRHDPRPRIIVLM